jgi:hypothetical protein
MILELEGGGDAELVSGDGDQAVLLSTRPFPPGSSLVGRRDGESGKYWLKVRACRSAGGRFQVEGRFVNLSRAQRAAVLAALESEPRS